MSADMLTLLKLRWPHANSHIPGLIEGIAASSDVVFLKYGLDSKLTIAHAMAQFSHECGAGTEMVENLNYSAGNLMRVWPNRFGVERANEYAHQAQKIADAVYNGRMGNRIGTDDGWNFRGRGLSQVTGLEGYEKLGEKVGLDLMKSPNLVNDPKNALECGVADFIICGCLPFAEKDDIYGVTHKLNGGYIGLAERKKWLAVWKRDLGIN